MPPGVHPVISTDFCPGLGLILTRGVAAAEVRRETSEAVMTMSPHVFGGLKLAGSAGPTFNAEAHGIQEQRVRVVRKQRTGDKETLGLDSVFIVDFRVS